MIRIRGYSKRFGRQYAVEDLNLDLDEGDIFGFIGPNGAGKTTTMRFLATLLAPTRGEAWVNGYSVTRQTDKVKRSIGFMPDQFGVYDGMKVWEYLDFFAICYGIPRKRRVQILEDVLALTDLVGKRDTLASALSRGMRQRLALAKTLVHDPPVLILDEPASGLDPRARIELKELMRELRRMGKTILISSHILSELADICTKIGIIEKGRLLAAGKVADILGSIRECRVIEIDVAGEEQKTENVIGAHPCVRNLNAGGKHFKFEFAGTDEELVALHRALFEAGVPLVWFREVEANLEDGFLAVTKGEGG